jgi:hypothetical protein
VGQATEPVSNLSRDVERLHGAGQKQPVRVAERKCKAPPWTPQGASDMKTETQSVSMRQPKEIVSNLARYVRHLHGAGQRQPVRRVEKKESTSMGQPKEPVSHVARAADKEVKVPLYEEPISGTPIQFRKARLSDQIRAAPENRKFHAHHRKNGSADAPYKMKILI